MISIDIEFLTGRYIATVYNDRERAEWPPEPARFFSACVATLHEFDDLDSKARAAIEWLETLGPPHVVASPGDRRAVSDVFVPVNDATVCSGWEKAFAKRRIAEVNLAQSEDEKNRIKNQKKLEKSQSTFEAAVQRSMLSVGKTSSAAMSSAASLIPENRVRQPRTFPSVSPWNPLVSFIWPDAKIEEQCKQGLEAVLSRLVRLGHSSSLVQARLGDGAVMHDRANDLWEPDPSANDITLRVVEAGQLRRLEASFEEHQGCEPRVLPCSFQNYKKANNAEPLAPASVFGSDWVIFRTIPEPGERKARRYGLRRGVDLARALRATLMSFAEGPGLESLSGHARDGEALSANHVAYVPLADVAGQWARGGILGIAVVLPRAIESSVRTSVYQAIGKFESAARSEERPCRLYMGRLGALNIERVRDRERRTTLRSQTWCSQATRWASVTPVALDRHPGDLASRNPDVARAAEQRAKNSISLSCERIGLPAPSRVHLMRRSVFDAAPECGEFMPYPRDRNPKRLCVHAELVFDRRVQGPILLGAGRYFGLGLFRQSTRGGR